MEVSFSKSAPRRASRPSRSTGQSHKAGRRTKISILIFVVAVLGSLVLDRQERRHRFEKRQEYERLAWEVPLEKPKLSMIESWANVVLGIILFALGAFFLKMMLGIPAELMTSRWENLVALFLASGFALVWLGVKAIRQNIRYARGISGLPISDNR